MNAHTGYDDILGRLNRQSVLKHFDAYEDVPWDDPDCRIVPDDPRWELGDDHVLGATDWYKAQPQSVRARLGLYGIVSQMKLGVEFESILSRGLLEFTATLPNGAPEFRYAYHELIEEGQHSLMFQEFINRAGLPVSGLDAKTQTAARRVVRFGRVFPELFFMFVLGGEEPIDSVQREALKTQRERLHPLIKRVMQIHVTEEARHLCFAREYLKRNVPALSASKMTRLRVVTPVILGEMAKLMMRPPERLLKRYHVPDSVIDEAYRHNPRHRQKTIDSISNIRKLCVELGVVTPASKLIWRRYGIWPDA